MCANKCAGTLRQTLAGGIRPSPELIEGKRGKVEEFAQILGALSFALASIAAVMRVLQKMELDYRTSPARHPRVSAALKAFTANIDARRRVFLDTRWLYSPSLDSDGKRKSWPRNLPDYSGWPMKKRPDKKEPLGKADALAVLKNRRHLFRARPTFTPTWSAGLFYVPPCGGSFAPPPHPPPFLLCAQTHAVLPWLRAAAKSQSPN